MSIFKKKEEQKEIVVVEKREIMPPVTEQTITDYMKAFGLAGNLEDNEVEAFKQMAIMHNLNPFNREIYCNAYGTGQYRTLSIVTGYEVYIRKAEQSGLLEYWLVEESLPETPVEEYWAKLIIKRHDKAREQTWTTHYSEGVQRKKDGSVTAFWKKQPRMMTKKVAMSQGFRLFFEDVMHGIPYTREEMPEEKGGMTDVTPNPEPLNEETLQPKPKSIKDMNKNELLDVMIDNYEKQKPRMAKAKDTIRMDNVTAKHEEFRKKKAMADNYNKNDTELQPEPTKKPEPPTVSPESVFKEVIAIVNGKTLTSQEKIETIKLLKPAKGDLAELQKILNNIKGETD